MEKFGARLENKNIFLRKPEPEDLEFLYKIENNPEYWFVSDTKAPYSRWQLKQHIENSIYDIYTNKELRLIICQKKTNLQIGIIDLFEFDPANSRCGIGIIIDKKFQNLGIAYQSLEICLSYCFNILDLHQVWCNILSENAISVKLFTKFGFELTGILKEWKKIENRFVDVGFYQLIKK